MTYSNLFALCDICVVKKACTSVLNCSLKFIQFFSGFQMSLDF